MKRRLLLLLALLIPRPGSAAISNLTGLEWGDVASSGSASSGDTTVVTSPARTGNYALRTACAGANACVMWIRLAYGADGQGADAPTGYVRFGFLYVTKPASGDEQLFTAKRLELRLGSDGKLAAYDVTTFLARGTTALEPSTWYLIEVKTVPAGWEVRLSGQAEGMSGADDLSGTVQTVGLGKETNRNSQTVDFYFDDFAADPSGWIGDGRIVALKPNADGYYTAWVAGAVGMAGTYLDIDEGPGNPAHDGDTTYVKSVDLNDAETANVEDTPGKVSGTINALRASIYARRVSANTTNIALRTRSNGTDTTLANVSIISTWGQLSKVHTTDPATGQAWLAAGIDGFQVGVVHKQSQNREANMTWAGVQVDFTPAQTPRSYVLWFN